MAGLSELVTSTYQRYQGRLVDNIMNHNYLLKELKAKGGYVAAAGGRTILEEMMYAENGTETWYSGYDTISTNSNDVLTAAEFAWKQLAGTIKFSGVEIDIQNTGPERIHNLVTSRMKVLEISLMNTLATGLYADGTGSSGKEIGGLQLLIADDPTADTVGGINRATAANAFYRNQRYRMSTDGGLVASSATINTGMNRLYRLVLRGSDHVQCIAADDIMFGYYEEYLQDKQRVTTADSADAGFMTLKFKNANVFYDDQCPASHMYFINLDYLKLRYASKRNFTQLADRAPSDVAGGTVDATVRPVVWGGNFTLSNAARQGVLLPT